MAKPEKTYSMSSEEKEGKGEFSQQKKSPLSQGADRDLLAMLERTTALKRGGCFHASLRGGGGDNGKVGKGLSDRPENHLYFRDQ